MNFPVVTSPSNSIQSLVFKVSTLLEGIEWTYKSKIKISQKKISLSNFARPGDKSPPELCSAAPEFKRDEEEKSPEIGLKKKLP